jgi:endo-1,4-beta-mannosidase
MGEHIDQLGNPKSRTVEYIREYTSAIVSRYKGSPAIWGWEFGNEYNLDCELPNRSEHRPPIVPDLGTPASRNEHDELTFAQLEVAFRAFAESIRKIDPTRIILTGNAVPRSSAWHNAHENSWKADSAEQASEILQRDNPDPIDTLSLHLYPERGGVYFGGTKSIEDALSLANAVARKAKKPLVLGEFGFSRKGVPPDQQRVLVKEFITGIKTNHVPLSAFWVFDFGAQNDEFNVTLENDHSWILKEIARANKELATESTEH